MEGVMLDLGRFVRAITHRKIGGAAPSLHRSSVERSRVPNELLVPGLGAEVLKWNRGPGKRRCIADELRMPLWCRLRWSCYRLSPHGFAVANKLLHLLVPSRFPASLSFPFSCHVNSTRLRVRRIWCSV